MFDPAGEEPGLFARRASKERVAVTERKSGTAHELRLVRSDETHDVEEIARRARRLMASLGIRLRGSALQDTGWTFGFDRARTRLGCCSWGPSGGKRISISRPFAEAYGWALMEDVVRHEIAHALDVDGRRRTDHGPRWKAWARRCGADPTRLYDGGEEVRLPPKYVAVCPACGDQSEYYRKPRHASACSDCCKRYNRGRYHPRFRLVFHPAEAVPGKQLSLFKARR